MASYELTRAADEDLDRLYVFGFHEFGERQADAYYEGMVERFEELVINPYLWQGVDDLRRSYRRSVYKKHSIYYRIDNEDVVIVRILGRENIEILKEDLAQGEEAYRSSFT